MQTVKIEYRGIEVSEFKLAEVDHIKVVKMFDVEAFAEREAPEVNVHYAYALNTPKSGRLIEVVTFDSNRVCTLHYYNADVTQVTFA